MKNFIITSLLFFFGITTQAQGPLQILNFTNKTIKIQLTAYTNATGNINPTCNGTYFTALSATSPFTIIILPNTNYTLTNYSTFTPNATLINKWQKYTNNVAITQIPINQMVGVPIWSSFKCSVFTGTTPYAAFGVGRPTPSQNCSGYLQSYNGVAPIVFSAGFTPGLTPGATSTLVFTQ